jgi:hypothetical protein
MVAVQLGISIPDAPARLRAAAFTADQSVLDLARDVINRRVTFATHWTSHHRSTGTSAGTVNPTRIRPTAGTGGNAGRPHPHRGTFLPAIDGFSATFPGYRMGEVAGGHRPCFDRRCARWGPDRRDRGPLTLGPAMYRWVASRRSREAVGNDQTDPALRHR